MPRFSITVQHEGLHKLRVISGTDPFIVQQKAELQLRQWNDQWANSEHRRMGREHRESLKAQAEEQTAFAEEQISVLSGILQATLSVNDAIDWNSLKDTRPFPEPAPVRPALFEKQKPAQDLFKARRTLKHRLLPWIERTTANQELLRFQAALGEWTRQLEAAQAAHARFQMEAASWNKRRAQYTTQQLERIERVEHHRQLFQKRDPDAISDYFDLVLSRSRYPDYFPQEFQLQLDIETGVIAVDYELPRPDALPKIKQIKYIATRNELQEVLLPEVERNRQYNAMGYQVALRTIHELFESDVLGVLKSVGFNGWVTSVDAATGIESRKCICSVYTQREDFVSINLAKVDPKACFKKLKGVAAAELHGMTPIAPVISLNKEDSRFVQGLEVASRLNEGVNLASMDWEEFEHLVRQLFEQEFSSSGGEVRVTRASRDGGVDAVAFDPDPIRGGKTIIQAKRYTNTVGVSAVRDLYGTVMSEGANKGILVCTSDYGPDSHDFARGKPLILINGSNLLHLLSKHGHKAFINLSLAREARKAEQ